MTPEEFAEELKNMEIKVNVCVCGKYSKAEDYYCKDCLNRIYT